MDTANIRCALENFDFARLFINCLGWSNPQSKASELNGIECREIARIGPIPALLIQTEIIPDTAERQKIGAQIAKVAAENVIV